MGAKTDKKRSKIDAKMRSNFALVFGSIFDRFWGPFGHHFEAMLGIMLGIGDIAKIIKNLQVLMNFHGLGSPSWGNFLMFLGCLFQDRFLIVLGSVLGSILGPFWR